MTWWREEGSYGVYFNRDERKTRPRATPPYLWDGGFLSPQDPAAGGTWMAVNPHGLILALLNRWHEGASGTRSRGLLIPSLISARAVEELTPLIEPSDFSGYSPFTLVAIDSHASRRWDWDGQQLTAAEATAPITSSSYRFEDVRSQRLSNYQETIGDHPEANRLSEYHREAGQGAFSVRMCRPDAQTWSRSRVDVRDGEIRWDYLEEFLDFQRAPEPWQERMARVPA